jgi:hypothetical protein
MERRVLQRLGTTKMKRLLWFFLLTSALAVPTPLAGCKKNATPPPAVITNESAVRQFWDEFRDAVGSGNVEQVADMVDIPSTAYRNRKELMDDFEFLLMKEVKDRIAETTFEALKHESPPEGKEYWRFDYNNGVQSEGQFHTFWDIGFAGDKVKFVEVFAAG